MFTTSEIAAFAKGLRGQLLRPGTTSMMRRGRSGMDDRQSPRVDRASSGRRRCHPGGRICPRERSRACGARGRPQRLRQRRLRRGIDARSLPDAKRSGRSEATEPSRGRRHAVARSGPRCRGLRPGDDGRSDQQHRHRWSNTGRRPRLVDGQLWIGLRQPSLGRSRDRGGRAGHGQRQRERRSLLGSARRRRQFRRRHLSRVPASSGGPDAGRSDHSPPGAGCRPLPFL